MNPAPLFKALIPLLTGILFYAFTGMVNPVYLLIVSSPFLLWLSLQIFWPDQFLTYKNRWTTGLCIYALFFCCGCALCSIHTEINDSRHFSAISKADSFVAVVDEPPVEKEKSYKSVLKIIAVNEGGKCKQTIGKCLGYFKKDSISKSVKYGDEIIFTASPVEVAPPPNPSQFNYKRFLAYRNIYHQVYLKTDDWNRIDRHKNSSLVESAINLRDKLLSIFKENKIEGQDYAVLSALILGEEDEIDQGTINAFAASGTLHVLSVSGMHVGIIFIVLDRILFFMNRKRSLKIIKSVLLIFFLGGYALLTGLSPPVLRSAAMLGLIVLGISLERHNNSWNIISASGLALLFVNPFMIMDVGFELSYLAVIGIIFLYKRIYNQFYFSNRIIREIWNIISVSLAAQLATFPLGLYYFHQFPNYFLLSNLIIIPLSGIIIYGGILLLAISKWSLGALIVGRMVGWCVHALNLIVIWIEHLPHALINKISISAFETILIYSAILLFIFLFLQKQQKFLVASLSILCLILIVQIVEIRNIRSQKQLVIFNAPKHSAINFIEGRKSLFLADTSLTNNESSMLYNVRHYWWDRGIKDEVSAAAEHNSVSKTLEPYLYIRNNFIQFHDKRMIVITNRDFLNYTPKDKVKVDYLIFRGNPKVKISDLLSVFKFQRIIFDSSNSIYHCNKWKEDCRRFGIEYHDVAQQGAFISDI